MSRFRRAARRGRRRSSQDAATTTGPVGTEALALEQLKRNQTEFGYPPQGFTTRIEYSLLYSMICQSQVYPYDIVKQHIEQEDFSVYLPLKETTKENNQDELVSYAQLSAILAIAADQVPPPKQTEQPPNEQEQKQPIAQLLGKAVMQCVFEYAREHDLDRKVEIQDLLQPVERYAIKRQNKQSMDMIIPLYVGYAAFLVTANPIPMVVGAVLHAKKSKGAFERAENMQSIASQASRKANAETTSLLEEADDV